MTAPVVTANQTAPLTAKLTVEAVILNDSHMITVTPTVSPAPSAPTVTWVPDLQADEQPRTYKTWGSKDLKTWEEVPEGKGGDYNFFKVSVEMPK